MSIGAEVGRRLAAWRAERRLTQRAAAVLIGWPHHRLASLEAGRREDLTLTEAVHLCRATGWPLVRFLPPDVASALTDPSPPPTELPAPDDADERLAGRLGVDADVMRRAAHDLWGTTFTAERDSRCPSGPSLATRRGHVTRSMTNDLVEHLGRPT